MAMTITVGVVVAGAGCGVGVVGGVMMGWGVWMAGCSGGGCSGCVGWVWTGWVWTGWVVGVVSVCTVKNVVFSTYTT